MLSRKEQCKERCREFFSLIHPLVGMEGVYTYVTAKTSPLAMIDCGQLSPILCTHLVVGSLKPDAIVESFQSSCVFGETKFTTIIQIEPEIMTCLGEMLCGYTAGIPRLIETTLEALCRIKRETL
jgi:hypothetical protein